MIRFYYLTVQARDMDIPYARDPDTRLGSRAIPELLVKCIFFNSCLNEYDCPAET